MLLYEDIEYPDVECTLEICRVKDGVVLTHPRKWFAQDDPAGDYLWSEGNYSCDCNRSEFFASAGGKLEPTECGDGKYAGSPDRR